MLWRRPYPSNVFKGKDEHTKSIEYLQTGTMAQADFGNSLRYGGCDISHYQQHQDRIYSARGWLPAATVFKDLENTMPQSLSALWVCGH